MPSSLPPWLLEARTASAPRRPVPPNDDRADLEPGDLWVFTSVGTSRIQRVVLIMDLAPSAGSVTAALVSTEVDLASDLDVVLGPEHHSAGYPLMVETAFVATLHWANAVRRVGMVSDELLDHLINFVWYERPEPLESMRGHAWTEPAQGERAAFEDCELADLAELARTSDPRFGGAPPTAAIGFDAATAVAQCRRPGADEYLVGFLEAIDTGTARHCEYIFDADPVCFADLWTAESPRTPQSALTMSDIRGLMQPLVDRLLVSQDIGICHLDVEGAPVTLFADGVLPAAVALVAPRLAERSAGLFVTRCGDTSLVVTGLPDE
jgi:hypothetical protein